MEHRLDESDDYWLFSLCKEVPSLSSAHAMLDHLGYAGLSAQGFGNVSGLQYKVG